MSGWRIVSRVVTWLPSPKSAQECFHPFMASAAIGSSCRSATSNARISFTGVISSTGTGPQWYRRPKASARRPATLPVVTLSNASRKPAGIPCRKSPYPETRRRRPPTAPRRVRKEPRSRQRRRWRHSDSGARREPCPFWVPALQSCPHAPLAVLPRGAPLQLGRLRVLDRPPHPRPGLQGLLHRTRPPPDRLEHRLRPQQPVLRRTLGPHFARPPGPHLRGPCRHRLHPRHRRRLPGTPVPHRGAHGLRQQCLLAEYSGGSGRRGRSCTGGKSDRLVQRVLVHRE